MVAADDDRRFHLAAAHELIKAMTGAGAFAITQPADARRQALKMDALTCRFDPAHQRRVVAKLLHDRAVRGRDVGGIAGQRDPPKRSLAFAEQRPDVGGYKSGKVERSGAAAQPSLRTETVAVVEHLGATIEKGDHCVDVHARAIPGASNVCTEFV